MITTFVILALATSAVSLTVSKSEMFAPIRNRLTGTWRTLATCHYCLSHWVAIVLVALYNPGLVSLFWPIDIVVQAFAVVALAAVSSSIIIYGMRSASR